MRPNQLPITREQVHGYHSHISRTDEYLAAREEVRMGARSKLEAIPVGEARQRVVRALTRETIARAAGNLIGNTSAYEGIKFDPAYNTLLRALPDLNEGTRGLHENLGEQRANKEKIIHFNHALKNLINTHPAISPNELTEMLTNTLFINGYDNSLLEQVQRDIIPGMEHELAFESNLFYLPGDPEIIDTTVDKELRGVDYTLRYDDGITLTIDVKKGAQSAAQKTLVRAERRKQLGYKTPDSHLIIASGYEKRDFMPGKIGRVTEQAREREQARISGVINTTHQRIAGYRQRIDNYSKI